MRRFGKRHPNVKCFGRAVLKFLDIQKCREMLENMSQREKHVTLTQGQNNKTRMSLHNNGVVSLRN